MQNWFAPISIRTSSFYWFMAALWIWLSDRVLFALVTDVATIHRLQTAKDLCFVTLTAVWLYLALRRRLDRARRQVETNNALLAAIVESSDDAIISKTLDGIITSWNQAATDLFGYRADEVIGRNITILFPPNRLQEEEEILARLRRGEQVMHYETVRQRKDGTLLPVSLSVSPVKNTKGELVGISKTARDLRERQKLEFAYQESEDRFRSLFEQTAVSHLIIDLDEIKVVDCNEVAVARLGYAKAELVGLPITALDAQFGVKEIERVRDALTSGQLVQMESRLRAKTGVLLDSLIVATKMSIGGKACANVTILDITEQKHAAAALAQQALELQRSNKDLEQFAYVASHDLQEPLRAVAGCVRVLQRRYQERLDAQADELIHHIVDGAARMQKLIEDLLDYSRLNTKDPRREVTDAEKALAVACSNLQVAVAESQVTITHDPLPTVQANAGQLALLFQNLLSNAIKFRGTASLQVHIGVAREKNYWRFFVRDNGIGIEPQYSDRIFRIFQRLHTRTEYPGTGIGLAICQKIVEQHGGEIGVASKLGTGATFYFTLPATEAEKEAATERVDEHLSAHSGSL